MSKYRKDILKLREEGKSYNQIKSELGCSLSTVSYHCSKGQKIKTNERQKRYLSKNPLTAKVKTFVNKKLKSGVRDFQRRDGNSLLSKVTQTFNWKDILNKFGENTVCYLSGESLNLMSFEQNYHFDHIVPTNKGGDNSIDNLGITHPIANMMKTDLTVDEFLIWCEKILKYNGYKVEKL